MKDAARALPAEDAQTIEQLIRSRYDDLSPSDRKLSDVIVAHQKDLAAYSATELAQLAGVSKASAARYFKRIGYQDFSEFRTAIRARVCSTWTGWHRRGTRTLASPATSRPISGTWRRRWSAWALVN